MARTPRHRILVLLAQPRARPYAVLQRQEPIESDIEIGPEGNLGTFAPAPSPILNVKSATGMTTKRQKRRQQRETSVRA